ncbi:MAG: hypothetical protein ACLFVR_14680 [Thiohalospira sp.]
MKTAYRILKRIMDNLHGRHMRNKNDISMLYNKETGNARPNFEIDRINWENSEWTKLPDYVEWLEEKIIELKN